MKLLQKFDTTFFETQCINKHTHILTQFKEKKERYGIIKRCIKSYSLLYFTIIISKNEKKTNNNNNNNNSICIAP